MRRALFLALAFFGTACVGSETDADVVAGQSMDLRANASYGHALVRWNPLTASYGIDATRKRGTISISTLGVGTSAVTARVRFTGYDLANPTNLGNFQVVAFGTSNTRCQLADVRGARTPSAYSEADVRCYDPASPATTTQSDFLITFTRNSSANASAPNSAYALIPASGVLQPGPGGINWAYSRSGGVIEYAQRITGYYDITFHGVKPIEFIDEGVSFVTAIAPSYRGCSITNQESIDAEKVSVQCFDAAGNLAATSFSLYWANEHTPSGNGQYGTALEPPPAWYPEYDTWDDYTSSASAPNGKVQRLLEGIRTVNTGFDVNDRAGAIVSARSYGGGYCKVAGISPYLRWIGLTPYTSMTLDVRCFDKAGAAKTSAFHEMLFVP